MSRIRHATETFVNNLIEGIKKLIASNTKQINVLYTNGFNGEYRHYDGDLTDLNDFTTPGKFEIVKDLSTIKNLPVNTSGLVRFSIVVEKRISNVYRQEIHFKSTPFFNRAFYRDTLDNGDWGEWAEVATTTKTDISYTLNGGLTFRSENDSKGEYTETLASIRIMIDVNNADIFNWDFVWCTLPPQLRPRHQLSDILLDSSTGIVSINVLPNGDIIRGNSMPETKPTWIMGYVPMYGRSM